MILSQSSPFTKLFCRTRLLLAFVLVPAVLFASKDYQEGKELAEELVMPDPSEVNTKDIPDFEGADVPESDYLENPHLMGDKAASLASGKKNEAGKVLQEGLQTRKEFHEVFDGDSPLIQESNEINDDPLSVIGGDGVEEEGDVVEVIETRHTCEEAGEPEEFSCDKTPVFEKNEKTIRHKRRIGVITSFSDWRWTWRLLHVSSATGRGEWIESPCPRHQYWSEFFLRWFKGRDDETGETINILEIKDLRYLGVKGGDFSTWHPLSNEDRSKGLVYFEVDIIEKKTEITEHWENNCSALEGYVDQNRCAYKSRSCVEGPETRIIHGKPVTKDCWRERQTYLCQSPSLNNCGPLRAKGCDQREVECTKRSGSVCVAYRKTFTCRSEKRGNGITRIKGDVPFCLDGNCDTHAWDSNKDFALAMSKLSIFREMAKDMEGDVEPSAFKGETRGCTRAVLGFQDCCGGDGGWGSSLSLSQNCSPEEKLLKREKAENRCVFVGTHCVQKDPVLKTCLKKKSSYCCFGSKIAKLFHAQGRVQLGIDWGSSENPNCRAFSIEELQAIDFEKIDLSELFEEIQARTHVENVAHAATSLTETWSGKVKSIKRGDEQGGGGDDGVF